MRPYELSAADWTTVFSGIGAGISGPQADPVSYRSDNVAWFGIAALVVLLVFLK